VRAVAAGIEAKTVERALDAFARHPSAVAQARPEVRAIASCEDGNSGTGPEEDMALAHEDNAPHGAPRQFPR
jgi:hypothetical protein